MENIYTGLNCLNALIGTWNMEGKIADSKEEIYGIERYEWASDECYVMRRSDTIYGDKISESLEIIGTDDETGKSLTMHSFSSDHNFETLQMTFIDEGLFSITGEKVRATIVVLPDSNIMEAVWEKTDDGIAWQPWMQLHFQKEKKQQPVAASC